MMRMRLWLGTGVVTVAAFAATGALGVSSSGTITQRIAAGTGKPGLFRGRRTRDPWRSCTDWKESRSIGRGRLHRRCRR